MKSNFEIEKEAYWKMRDELLEKYQRKWVAVANRKVVAVGDSATDVLKAAYEKTKVPQMYINKVGEEEEAMKKRIRRYSLKYDPPLPMVDAVFSRLDGMKSVPVEGIIDTGADTTVLPDSICSALDIYKFQVTEAEITGLTDEWETRALGRRKRNDNWKGSTK